MTSSAGIDVDDASTWRPVVFTGSETAAAPQASLYCSVQGQFYNKDTRRIIKPYFDRSRNRLRVQWGAHTAAPHVLVMNTWGQPEPSPHYRIEHVDGNKSNNALTNLRWVLQSELSAARMANLSKDQLRGFTEDMFLFEATGDPNTVFDFAAARPGRGHPDVLVSPQGLVCDAVTHKLLFLPVPKSGRRLVRVKSAQPPSATSAVINGSVSVPRAMDNTNTNKKADVSGTIAVFIDDLVARTFLEPEKLPISVAECKVVHLDGNPRDCRVENLRWAALTISEKRLRQALKLNSQPYVVVNMADSAAPVYTWYKSFDDMYDRVFRQFASSMPEAAVRRACDLGSCVDDLWPKRMAGGIIRVDPDNPQLASAFLSAEHARRTVGIEPRDLLEALNAGPSSGWRRASREYDDVIILYMGSPGTILETGKPITFYDTYIYHSKTAVIEDLTGKIPHDDWRLLSTAEVEARCMNHEKFDLGPGYGKPEDGFVQLWYYDDFLRELYLGNLPPVDLQEPNLWDKFGFSALECHKELAIERAQQEPKRQEFAEACDKQRAAVLERRDKEEKAFLDHEAKTKAKLDKEEQEYKEKAKKAYLEAMKEADTSNEMTVLRALAQAMGSK